MGEKLIQEGATAGEPTRLESWKQIAVYLGRTVRTVQRWEREQQLPVRRLAHNKQSTVYAYVHELEGWRLSRAATLDTEHDDDGQPCDGEEDDVGSVVGSASSGKAASGTWRLWATLAWITIALGVAVLFSNSYLRHRSPAQLVAIGRGALNERTPASFERARQAFLGALSLDRRNPFAFAGLADTYALLESFDLMQKADALGQAADAARQAVRFGPLLAESHTSLSFVL
jgi:hypothetical protein